ncbi:hypothetical protein AAG570_001947 [Ranatra chinensis]|uniref:palmitoyl-CoA hydrolase n=1 Tax=Ranatra chinensis TaxID=642074 RepID=A0ABD0YNZ2_9HEMI
MGCYVRNLILFYIFLASALCTCVAYKPVVIVHGVLGDGNTMKDMSDRINELHPNTKVYLVDRFEGWSSLRPMWHQVLEVGADIMKIMAFHPDGIHLIGYSQGGLLARGVLEYFNFHNVHTFVSLSSPQGGQYGTKFLHIFFPTLACEEAYELFYSVVGQHTSVGNYWNDPHHQDLYLKYSVFLPYLNNEIYSNNSSNFKSGITKLKKMVLIGGPDDEVITPWQSSHFGYFDANETVVEMTDQPYYKNDSFGLLTLNKSGRLQIFELSGNTHIDWHINQTIIDDYIVPFLD